MWHYVENAAPRQNRPNIFQIAGFPRREIVSSNIFAYYLDPDESHGLNDMALKALLSLIGKTDEDTSDCTVETEVSTDKNNRIDILITLPNLSIAIENKVDADLYNDLFDYYKRAADAGHPAVVVVLHTCTNINLNGHPSASNLTIGENLYDIHYDDFFDQILNTLGHYCLDADSRATDLLQQFIDNYSFQRQDQQMTSVEDEISQFIIQSNGIERQILDFQHQWVNYFTACRKKLTRIHAQLVSDLDEHPLTIHGQPITMVEHWQWFEADHKKEFSKGHVSQFYCQNFHSSNKKDISFEFFLNGYNDNYSSVENGAFGTIWYKAYWGGLNQWKHQITSPYYKRVSATLTDNDDIILDAIKQSIEDELAKAWNM